MDAPGVLDLFLQKSGWPVGEVHRTARKELFAEAVVVDDDDVAWKVTVEYDDLHTAPSQRP